MVACQRPRHQSQGQDEAHLVRTAYAVTLLLVVEGEEEDTMTGDKVEGFHQANGGEERHRQSASLAIVEEEEAVAVMEGPMATGMDGEEEDGDLPLISTSHRYGQHYRHPHTLTLRPVRGELEHADATQGCGTRAPAI